jgi:hypothetical protein
MIALFLLLWNWPWDYYDFSLVPPPVIEVVK